MDAWDIAVLALVPLSGLGLGLWALWISGTVPRRRR